MYKIIATQTSDAHNGERQKKPQSAIRKERAIREKIIAKSEQGRIQRGSENEKEALQKAIQQSHDSINDLEAELAALSAQIVDSGVQDCLGPPPKPKEESTLEQEEPTRKEGDVRQKETFLDVFWSFFSYFS